MSYFYFFLFALICEILGTIAGFGSSVIFVPVLNFFFPLSMSMMLTSILHNFSNVAKIVLFWRTINYRLLILFGFPSIILTITGAVLTAYINSFYAQIVLAAFLIFFSLLFLLFPLLKLAANTINAVATGSLAGFFAGFTGTGGAIRGIGLAAFNLEKDFFVGTSAAIDFGVDFSRFFIYLKNGFFLAGYLWYIPLLFVASFMGSWLGKKILNRIDQKAFKKIVLILILCVGIYSILRLLLTE